MSHLKIAIYAAGGRGGGGVGDHDQERMSHIAEG